MLFYKCVCSLSLFLRDCCRFADTKQEKLGVKGDFYKCVCFLSLFLRGCCRLCQNYWREWKLRFLVLMCLRCVPLNWCKCCEVTKYRPKWHAPIAVIAETDFMCECVVCGIDCWLIFRFLSSYVCSFSFISICFFFHWY